MVETDSSAGLGSLGSIGLGSTLMETSPDTLSTLSLSYRGYDPSMLPLMVLTYISRELSWYDGFVNSSFSLVVGVLMFPAIVLSRVSPATFSFSPSRMFKSRCVRETSAAATDEPPGILIVIRIWIQGGRSRPSRLTFLGVTISTLPVFRSASAKMGIPWWFVRTSMSTSPL